MRDFKEIASEGEMHSGEIGHVMFTIYIRFQFSSVWQDGWVV